MANRVVVLCVAMSLSGVAHGAIVSYAEMKSSWLLAAGGASEINFVGTGSAPITVASTAYSSQGVTLASSLFPNGCDWSIDPTLFANDGWDAGPDVWHSGEVAVFNFYALQTAFAFEAWGSSAMPAIIKFFNNGQLVGSTFSAGGPFQGSHFYGWTTDFEFDRVELGHKIVDNIFVATVPAPAASIFLAMSLLKRRRSR